MSGPFVDEITFEEFIKINAQEGFYKLPVEPKASRTTVVLATLTEALGSHVISVLRQYPERAAEYLRNWHTQCIIYHDCCVVTRRGEVIAKGTFDL